MPEVIEELTRHQKLIDANTKLTPEDAMDILRDVRRIGPTGMARSYWAHGRRGIGLRLDPGGVGRFAEIVGTICAYDEIGHPDINTIAKKLAFDFVRLLDYFSCFGGRADDAAAVPMNIVELSDDGQRHNFRVIWYVAELHDASTVKQGDRYYRTGDGNIYVDQGSATSEVPYTRYRFREKLFGAAIYRGPLAGAAGSVLVGTSDNAWTVHT